MDATATSTAQEELEVVTPHFNPKDATTGQFDSAIQPTTPPHPVLPSRQIPATPTPTIWLLMGSITPSVVAHALHRVIQRPVTLMDAELDETE